VSKGDTHVEPFLGLVTREKRVPRLVIDLFAKSNGVVIKVGDASHPKAVEVVACYPDWAERNESLLTDLNDLLRSSVYKKADYGEPDYVT